MSLRRGVVMIPLRIDRIVNNDSGRRDERSTTEMTQNTRRWSNISFLTSHSSEATDPVQSCPESSQMGQSVLAWGSFSSHSACGDLETRSVIFGKNHTFTSNMQCCTAQPVRIHLNKKLDSKQKIIQAFNIDALGFRKTRNENALMRVTEVTS